MTLTLLNIGTRIVELYCDGQCFGKPPIQEAKLSLGTSDRTASQQTSSLINDCC